MLYRNFFVVSGKGVSKTSPLNAFDAALVEAGIAQCNLVPVSSILPEGAVEVPPREIEIGSITFTVLARCEGSGGERIAAGVGWAFVRDPASGKSYGMVVEDTGDRTGKNIGEDLRKKLLEMADARKVEIERWDKKIGVMEVPKGCFGCVVAALVYLL